MKRGAERLKSLCSGAISPSTLPCPARVVRRSSAASASIVSRETTAATASPTSPPWRTVRVMASSTPAMRFNRSRP